MLRLCDFLATERIVTPLRASTLLEAAEALRDRLVVSGAVANAEKLRHRIDEERTEDMVLMSET